MKIFKRLICAFLCVIIALSFASITPLKIDTSAVTLKAKIAAIKKKFPDGKYWNHVGSSKNNPDGWTETPCTHHFTTGCSYQPGGCECNSFNLAIQCAGYAYKIAYEITGSKASEYNGWTKLTKLDVSSLVAGDIIRYNYNSHSICVIGVSGTTIAYTGANWGGNCLIYWRQMDVSEISGFSYVYHKNGNKYKNPDIDVDSDEQKEDDEKPVSGEVWKTKTTNDSNLNVRSSASTSSSVVGTIPPGKKFQVLSKTYQSTTKYLWGKIKYGSVTGYCVLNYATYVSGNTKALKIKGLSNIYEGVPFTLKWNKIDGANKYTVKIYNASGFLRKTYTCTDCSRSIRISGDGTRSVKVIASNTQAASWKVASDKVTFSVFPKSQMKVSKISLPESIDIAAGQHEFCDFEITPSGATSDLKWTSNDPTVAVISDTGIVEAKKCGIVTITARSKSNSSISASCKVTVRPKKVTGLTQSFDGNSTSKLRIIWNSVADSSGYRVCLLKSDGKYKKLAEVKSPHYTYSSLSAGSKCKFVIRTYKVINGKKYFGDYSAPIAAYTVPAKVKNLKCVSQSANGFRIAWSKVKNANMYYVYKYSPEKKAWVKVSHSETLSCTLSGNAKGGAGKYAVCAVIKHNGMHLIGARSEWVYGFRAPSKPKLSASPGTTKVTLSWNQSLGATSYELQIRSGGKFKTIATPASTSRSFTVINLSSGKSYTFRLKAVSTHGKQVKKTASNELTVKTR